MRSVVRTAISKWNLFVIIKTVLFCVLQRCFDYISTNLLNNAPLNKGNLLGNCVFTGRINLVLHKMSLIDDICKRCLVHLNQDKAGAEAILGGKSA